MGVSLEGGVGVPLGVPLGGGGPGGNCLAITEGVPLGGGSELESEGGGPGKNLKAGMADA